MRKSELFSLALVVVVVSSCGSSGGGGAGGAGGSAAGAAGGRTGIAGSRAGAGGGRAGAGGGAAGGGAAGTAGGGAAGTAGGGASGAAGVAGVAGHPAGGMAGVAGLAGNGGQNAGGAGGLGGGNVVAGCGVTLGWGPAPMATFSPDGHAIALFAWTQDSPGPQRAPELRRWPDDSPIALAGNDLPSRAVAFSPDSKLFAASTQRALNVWSVADGTLVRQIPQLAGAHIIAISTNGAVVAAVQAQTSWDSAVIWRLSDPTNLVTPAVGAHPGLRANATTVNSIALSPDGSRLAAMYIGYDGLLQLHPYIDEWSTADGTLTWSNPYAVSSGFSANDRVVFSPDGTILAGNQPSGALLILDAATGTQIHQYGSVAPWIFSGDGTQIAGVDSSTMDLSPRVVRVSDGTITNPVAAGDTTTAIGVGFGASPANVALVASHSATAFVYAENGTPVGSRNVYSFSPIQYDAISPDGQLVAAAYQGPERLSILWDARTGAPVKSWPTSGPVAFSPDGSTLFALAVPLSDGQSVHLLAMRITPAGAAYDLDLGYDLAAFNGNPPQTLSVSPSGALVAFPGPQNTAQLRRASDGGQALALWDLHGHTDAVLAIAFSPDDKSVATGSYDKRIRLWDTATGTGGVFLTTSSAVSHLAFTPDGSRIVSEEIGGDLLVWDLATNQPSAMKHLTVLSGLALSPDGSSAYVAAGTADDISDDHLQVFHLPDLAPLPPVPGHTTPLGLLSLSRDGSRLADLHENQTVGVDCLK